MALIEPDPLRDQDWVAEYFGVSVRTVEDWRHRGVGPPFVKIGHGVRYPQSGLDAYVESRTVQPARS